MHTGLSKHPTAGTAPALRVQDVRKTYASGVHALDGVSLAIDPGEFVVLLGPNGAGKTTLFEVLTGLSAPDSGRVLVHGVDVRRRPAAALALCGIVFQRQVLDLDRSVASNLEYHAALHGLAPALARRRIAAELERVGLAGQADRRCRELSAGNRRRVELARALVHRPRLLLMDEPTAGLDPGARSALLRDVHRAARRRGMGVLWATHLVDEAEAADRVAILGRGRMLGTEAPAALVRRVGAAGLTEAFLALTG